ncbi:NADH dehydrogenase [ubiquinone] 1 alpha subcomplex subunit 11 [Anabrus simplex]|uniref:NADH dehydrogenase [ubiquinone] 1 alpha subcomplex subunit 11 n=1 Tax=Anabrus simplex TaxID=316456 RepID=UPI0034DDB4FA
MGYSYYDSPEGEDCFLKLWYTSKLATVAGLGISTFDVLFYSHPQGYYPTIARYAHFTFPLVGMAAAFTSTVCIATSLRHKDDKLNYFLGGCAAGAVFGTWRKSMYQGVRGCVFLGLAAVIKKMAIEEGWVLIPEAKRRTLGSLHGVRHDFTVTSERPRNWRTSEELE